MFMVLFGRRVFLNSPCQFNLTPQSADPTRQWWVTCVIESWLLLRQESVPQGSSDPWSTFYIIRVKYHCRIESQCLPTTPCWCPLRSTVMKVNGRCLLHLFYFFHLSLMLSNSHSLATFHHWAHFLISSVGSVSIYILPSSIFWPSFPFFHCTCNLHECEERMHSNCMTNLHSSLVSSEPTELKTRCHHSIYSVTPNSKATLGSSGVGYVGSVHEALDSVFRTKTKTILKSLSFCFFPSFFSYSSFFNK